VPASARKVAGAAADGKASWALKEGEKLMRKANIRQQKEAQEIKKYRNSENPDVAKLQAVRKKVFQEDQPDASKNQKEEDAVFAKAAVEEAALKASLHKEAAAKKAKHSANHSAPSTAKKEPTAIKTSANSDSKKAGTSEYRAGQVVKKYSACLCANVRPLSTLPRICDTDLIGTWRRARRSK